jgi:hypothetical protein
MCHNLWEAGQAALRASNKSEEISARLRQGGIVSDGLKKEVQQLADSVKSLSAAMIRVIDQISSK